jgi:hypothetical protein
MKTFVEFLESKGESLDEKKNFIKDAIKKPGRCTPFPNPDCEPGTPQYALAKRFKKGDLHKDKKKK